MLSQKIFEAIKLHEKHTGDSPVEIRLTHVQFKELESEMVNIFAAESTRFVMWKPPVEIFGIPIRVIGNPDESMVTDASR